jgi:quercetin dioxygenase-like cupin family protein
MNFTRRDLRLLLPALLAGAADAQQKEVLPSKCYPLDQLPVKTNPATHNETRQILDGATHDGYPVEVHLTTLPPGNMPHPAHHHVHEEMILIREGTMEVTIMGKSCRLGPGSSAYVHSNEEHGWKNVGDSPAQYFVLAVGREKT